MSVAAEPAAPSVHAPTVRPGREEFVLLNVARGIAALFVVPMHVVIHLSGNDGWKDGFEFAREFCIPFFFTLTGFVLVLAHRREIEKGWAHMDSSYLRRRLHVFAVKRVVRLYPIYWIVTAAVLAAAFMLPGAMSGSKLAPRYILQSFVAWPPDQTLPILPQGWTVPFVMKCYLLFALAYLIPWHRLRWMLIVFYAVVLLNTLRHLNLLGESVPTPHYLVDFFFHPFSWNFLYGMAAAFLVQKQGDRRGSVGIVVGALLIYAVLFAVDMMRWLPTYDLRMTVFGIAVGLLVYAFAQFEKGRAIRAPRAFTLLGDASYSLYITHLPLLIVMARALRAFIGSDTVLLSLPMIWLQVAVCVVFAFVFHRVIEEPLSKMLMNRLLPVADGPRKPSVSTDQVVVRSSQA